MDLAADVELTLNDLQSAKHGILVHSLLLHINLDLKGHGTWDSSPMDEGV